MAVKYVKFVRGSSLAFENVINKDSDTLYFITDSDSGKGSLYLGSKLISGNISDLADLKDILIDELTDGQILVYNEAEDKWINQSVVEAIGLMTGATSTAQGGAGLVPAPGIGQQNLFLRGDGTWAAPVGGTGSSSTTKIFETTATDFSYEKQTAALAQAVGNTSLTTGDIGIVKVAIAADTYQYTAYVYNGSVWAAMDGNYSSDSIYFDENLMVTSPIGTITQEMIDKNGGAAILNSSNKNMTQVLTSLLAEEKNPEVDLPSATFTTSGNSGEVGTTFVLPTATLTITDIGSYTYGSTDGVEKYDSTDTGIIFEPGNVVLSYGTRDQANTKTLGNQSTLSVTASGDNIYTDDSLEFVFKAIANYTASDRIPVTNLGNTVESLKITDGSIDIADITAKFVGYRNSFFGSNISPVELTSINIRGLAQKEKSSVNTLILNVVEGAKQIIIAVPTGRKVTKVEDTVAFGTNIFQAFVLTNTILVEGANGYNAKLYNVYVYTPATALGENKYIITVTDE